MWQETPKNASSRDCGAGMPPGPGLELALPANALARLTPAAGSRPASPGVVRLCGPAARPLRGRKPPPKHFFFKNCESAHLSYSGHP